MHVSARSPQLCKSRLSLACKSVLSALCLLSLLPSLRCTAQGNPPDVEIIPDEVLVGIKAANDDAGTPDRLAVVGQAVQYLAPIHAYRLKLRADLSVVQAIAALTLRADVVYAEPNHLVHHPLASSPPPNDPYFSQSYLGGSYPAQYGPHRIQADLAWNIWQPRRSITIAVLDSGIDYNHPDLVNMMERYLGGNPAGYVTTYANQQQPTSDAHDINGHGTNVAGIAAAEANNSIGVAGIAGWNGIAGQRSGLSATGLNPTPNATSAIRLLPVRVLYNAPTSQDAGNVSGTDADLAEGINYAAPRAQIINMSLGNYAPNSTTTNNAIQYAHSLGCVLVAAAGNNASASLNYPAAYQNVISVAASDNNDLLAGFSDYGPWVNVAAPGGQSPNVLVPNQAQAILSTVPTYSVPGVSTTNYGYFQGTSQACPHVAGEAALLMAQNPSLTNDQIRSIILNNTDPVTPYSGQGVIGGGRVNVYKALLAATSHGSDVKLLPVGSYLYGTTLAGGSHQRGAIFLVDPANPNNHSAGAVIYNFTGGADGAHPFNSLVQGADGCLYGTCSQGGQYGLGTIWRIYPDGSGFNVVYNMGAIGGGGSPYNGANPRCVLTFIPDNYTLVGVAPNGGASSLGTFFAVNGSGNFLTLYHFAGPPYDGSSPTDGVTLASDGTYWGVTQTGGAYGLGTVWRNTYTTDRAGHYIPFHIGQNNGGSAIAGAYPRGLLVEWPSGPGTFLGVMQGGGSNSSGLLFGVNGNSGFNPFYAFDGAGGASPQSGLIVGSDGAFWGVTPNGGQYGLGTVYRQTYANDSATHSVIETMGDTSGGGSQNGAAPTGALTLGLSAYASTYFGATSQGGDFNNGCVYALDGGGARRVIFMFPANF